MLTVVHYTLQLGKLCKNSPVKPTVNFVTMFTLIGIPHRTSAWLPDVRVLLQRSHFRQNLCQSFPKEVTFSANVQTENKRWGCGKGEETEMRKDHEYLTIQCYFHCYIALQYSISK